MLARKLVVSTQICVVALPLLKLAIVLCEIAKMNIETVSIHGQMFIHRAYIRTPDMGCKVSY